MSYRVISNDLSKNSIHEIVERNRSKGGGLLKRRPVEKLSYIQQVLWPVRYFSITLTKDASSSRNYSTTKKLFMLGNFSLPYVEEVLLTDGGRKALGTIFSRENSSVLSNLTRFTKALPVLSFYDPNNVFNRLQDIYTTKLLELERTIDIVREEVQPLYTESEMYRTKANVAKENAMKLKKDKGNPRFKEYKQMEKDFSKKAQSLLKEADKKIAEALFNYKKFAKKWERGKKRFLSIPKNMLIERFYNLETFFYHYWIARFESPEGNRYLILNNQGQQEKKLQSMLIFDSKLSSEIDKLFNFTAKAIKNSCFYCGEMILKNQKKCPKCGKETLQCSVCKLVISSDDQIGQCPLCEAKAHFVHLHEWVKTQGKCPKCLQVIKVEDIIVERKES